MNSNNKYGIMRLHAGNGLSYMTPQRMLENYAEELVAQFSEYDDEGYFLQFSSLPEDEKNELTRLYLDATGREISECVHGNDFSLDNNYICAILQMFAENSKENRENLAETIRTNIITYFSKSLQHVLDNACESYEHRINNENGLYAHVDMEHGDVLFC